MTAPSRTPPPAERAPRSADGQRTGGARMHARARIATALRPDGHGRSRTRLVGLRSQAPLMLRPTLPKAPEPWIHQATDVVRVSLCSAAAGPIGGDHYVIEARVGAGSSLVITQVAHTLLLPGRDGAASRTEIRIHVDDGATLIWLAEPRIAARGCNHVDDIEIRLGSDSRLLLREELLLGRHGEPPGRVQQNMTVTRPAGTVYRQDLRIGPDSGLRSVVTGGHRAVGSVLIYDPELPTLTDSSLDLPGAAALMPLADRGALITGLAEDSIALRAELTAGLALLGPAWSTGHPIGHATVHRSEGATP